MSKKLIDYLEYDTATLSSLKHNEFEREYIKHSNVGSGIKDTITNIHKLKQQAKKGYEKNIEQACNNLFESVFYTENGTDLAANCLQILSEEKINFDKFTRQEIRETLEEVKKKLIFN